MASLNQTVQLSYPHVVKLSRKLGVKDGRRQELMSWLSQNNITTWNGMGFNGACHINHAWDVVRFRKQEDKFLFVLSCGHLIN